MLKKQSTEVRLYCIKCKDYTQSIEPIIIIKNAGNWYYIKAMCSICNKLKTKFSNLKQVKLLFWMKSEKLKIIQPLIIM